MKRVVCLSIALILILTFTACNSKTANNPKNTNKPEAPLDFVPDYSNGKQNTRGNTVNLLQNGGYFAVQDQWIYYCNKNNIYKMPIGGGENDIYLLYSDKEVKSIQVMGDWIYFLEEIELDKWQIKRIRTDGSLPEVIVESKNIAITWWNLGGNLKPSTYIALEDWLYYMSITYGEDNKGNGTYTYHLTRTKTDGIKTEYIYSFEPQQTGKKGLSYSIDYIDDNGTIYYDIIQGEKIQKYFAINISGGEPRELFSSLLRANNSKTVLFMLALDDKGNTYFTGYDFFNVDENDVVIKKDFAYPVYYLNGALSSLIDNAAPVPLENGPGIDSYEQSHLSFVNGQLVTISYDPKKPSGKKYELASYDPSSGKITTVLNEFPETFDNTYPVYFADLKDGYIYFGFNDGSWWRVMPDDTGFEDLNWMLNPSSPKRPNASRP